MGIRRDIRDINFKRNLKIYFKFVKKHKAIVLALMFMVFLLEVIRVIEKYLFKILWFDM